MASSLPVNQLNNNSYKRVAVNAVHTKSLISLSKGKLSHLSEIFIVIQFFRFRFLY